MQQKQTPLPFLHKRTTRLTTRQRYRHLLDDVTKQGSRKIWRCLKRFSNRSFSPRDVFHLISSAVLYLLGPILIVVTFSLLFCLSWTFWNVILPLRFGSSYGSNPMAWIHQGFVVFVLVNILFNYVMCVSTKNGHNSQRYKTVVIELARATGFYYPETVEQIVAWRKEWRNTLVLGTRQRILHERYKHRRELGLLVLDDEEGESDERGDTMTLHPECNVCDKATSHGKASDPTTTTTTTTSASDPSSTLSSSAIPFATAEGTTTNASFLKKRKYEGDGMDAPLYSVKEESFKTQKAQPKGAPSWKHGRSWMALGPYDWSYCDRTQLPKPPRSHYDHVTQSLVLNMDHYCPWMFNCIGYFNYRYFVNFLIYVAMGMFYGAIVSFQPFMMIDSLEYKDQIMKSKELFIKETTGNFGSSATNEKSIDFGKKSLFRYSHVQHLIPNVPIPSEATPIAFSFMMCFAVGLSVIVLLCFHLYLILSAQTTIEFHGNRMKKQQCAIRGEEFRNPYDIGIRRNIEQVWGRWGKDDGQGSWFLLWTVLLPSVRENEYLPVPIKGDEGLRKHYWYKEDNNVYYENVDNL
jgi:Uncharacterized protein containing DHHC-type Zn finger